jgi:CDP-glucose 4,6-dehydratase
MDELAITSYVRSFFSNGEKKIVSVRAGNVIGGGDWSPDRLIPDIVRAFEKDEPVVLRNPDSIRPWQHVLEPLSGYLMMGEKMFTDDQYLGAYNFGPDISDTMRVEDIVKKAIEILGR